MLHDLFDFESLEMPDEVYDFITGALKSSGIRLMGMDMCDILFEDERMVASAIVSGNEAFLFLAITRLSEFRMLKGSLSAWETFAKECRQYMLERRTPRP